MVGVRGRVSKFITLSSASRGKCSGENVLHQFKCSLSYRRRSGRLLQSFAITRQHRRLPSKFGVMQCLDGHTLLLFFLPLLVVFFPREDADIRRCTQTTDERSTTSAVTSAHSLFNHRSISLTKFRKGEAQLPTKPRPYRKSFFKQTATKASARLPNHTAFDS